MRAISLDARRQTDAANSDDAEIVLIKVTHESLPAPIRMCTYPAEMITIDPYVWGLYSTWLTDDGSPFLYVMVSAQIPGDQEEVPLGAQLVIQNVDNDIASLLRGHTDKAVVDMAVVLASAPDLPEIEVRGLRLMSVEGTAADVTASIQRDNASGEPASTGRMTKERFPGIHR